MLQKLTWTVIHGKKLGRKLGFPTANIACKLSQKEDGVYVCNVVYMQKIYKAVGVYFFSKEVFEVYIFDFHSDIYGQDIEIIPLKKLRDNQNFWDVETLKKQILLDCTQAKKYTALVITFGSFDILHEGHIYYLCEAKKYGTQLLTIIARDVSIENIKWRPPKHKEKERKNSLKQEGICDIIELGSLNDPFVWFKKYNIDTVVLGYDQRWRFVEELESRQDVLYTNTKIIRIDAHKPEYFKSSLLRAAQES